MITCCESNLFFKSVRTTLKVPKTLLHYFLIEKWVRNCKVQEDFILIWVKQPDNIHSNMKHWATNSPQSPDTSSSSQLRSDNPSFFCPVSSNEEQQHRGLCSFMHHSASNVGRDRLVHAVRRWLNKQTKPSLLPGLSECSLWANDCLWWYFCEACEAAGKLTIFSYIRVPVSL